MQIPRTLVRNGIDKVIKSAPPAFASRRTPRLRMLMQLVARPQDGRDTTGQTNPTTPKLVVRLPGGRCEYSVQRHIQRSRSRVRSPADAARIPGLAYVNRRLSPFLQDKGRIEITCQRARGGLGLSSGMPKAVSQLRSKHHE